MVELLIKRQANVKAADRNGKTALDLTQDESIREALQTGLQEQEKRQGLDKHAKKVHSPHHPSGHIRHGSCWPAARLTDRISRRDSKAEQQAKAHVKLSVHFTASS